VPVAESPAIVLHVANYLESSRLLRLLTRDHGVQSVIARGARTSQKRFGSAIDLFAVGVAAIDLRSGRDLQTLHGFDTRESALPFAADLDRFMATSALAECLARMVHDEPAPELYDDVAEAWTGLAHARGTDLIASIALGALWRVVDRLGFSPVLDLCAVCGRAVPTELAAHFFPQLGGALCLQCAKSAQGGRLLPPAARGQLRSWLTGHESVLGPKERRAHQRLFREFVIRHITEQRPLRAYVAWETTVGAESSSQAAPEV
jgi:DNA repair protein RecO (recombination protein O)